MPTFAEGRASTGELPSGCRCAGKPVTDVHGSGPHTFTLLVYSLAEEYAAGLGEQVEGARLPSGAYIGNAGRRPGRWSPRPTRRCSHWRHGDRRCESAHEHSSRPSVTPQ
jgi:hypothetical protein